MAFQSSSCARAISPTSQSPSDDPAPVIGDTSIISFADTSFAQSATSYLSLSAFPSPPLAGEITFTDPFSLPAESPRPPSRASTIGERRGRVVPALTINPNVARKASAASSISVYSTVDDDFADDSHLQSYFSPISSDGDILSPCSGILSPFSGLAISTSGPLLSPVSPTTEWRQSAPASGPLTLCHVSATSLSSASEQTGSSHLSPLFDVPLPRSSTFTDASFDRNSPYPDLDTPPIAFNLEKGTWREHWSLDVSAAANPADDGRTMTLDAPTRVAVVEEYASDAASVREQELPRKEEMVSLEEYRQRELGRRDEERKRRGAVEQTLLYGEGEDIEHQFGFAY
ncbi:hypothetical protein JCM21900_003158 [Sporobolomyces salmonicolor]